jgi:rrf2 family protein (putative transcriptional regulator)
MKITLESDYALRLVQMLALENRVLDANTLSEKTKVSTKFALKILRKLLEADIVCSFKGAHGGYRLNRVPKDISMKDVIEVFEGKIAISRCIDCDYICSRMGSEKTECPYHRVYCEISKELSDRLSGISIQSILDGTGKK